MKNVKRMFMQRRTINSYLSYGNGKRPELSEMSVKRAFESHYKPQASSDEARHILRLLPDDLPTWIMFV